MRDSGIIRDLRTGGLYVYRCERKADKRRQGGKILRMTFEPEDGGKGEKKILFSFPKNALEFSG